jgi:hypothetical protein
LSKVISVLADVSLFYLSHVIVYLTEILVLKVKIGNDEGKVKERSSKNKDHLAGVERPAHHIIVFCSLALSWTKIVRVFGEGHHFTVLDAEMYGHTDVEDSNANVAEHKPIDGNCQLREGPLNLRAFKIQFSQSFLEETYCSKDEGNQDSVRGGPLNRCYLPEQGRTPVLYILLFILVKHFLF